ncbi:hypothetical protein [Parendozoicomonas haliclonae]|uniref:GIY-YIG domain-containing protein n=1 Tax=Parendozoicomonas haliclonae TaxID=1960125 RepID=A0A1X7AJX0_9GAMM|nr:hypothetical protein [Parendozoicomonas haliclonae]SMA47354.1 hypothetical protein EHSB41UT_02381 [Parendozoicomonas haliclonae]
MNTTKRTKACTKCGSEKPVADFHKSSSAKDGLQWHCKACIKLANKQYSKTAEGKETAHRKRYGCSSDEPRYIRVYRMYNPDTLESYIGQSIRRLSVRRSEHLKDAFTRDHESLLHNALRKTTREEAASLWKIEELCRCTSKAAADSIEALLIGCEKVAKSGLCLNTHHALR